MSCPSEQPARQPHPDSDDDPAELFAETLERFSVANARKLCAALRARQTGHRQDACELPDMTEKAICGNEHVLIPVQFPRGPRWIFKIPDQSTDDDYAEEDSAMLASEAQTMRFLRANTSMPIPTVIAYDASRANDTGCPFILMEFVGGISLIDLWYNTRDDCLPAQQARRRSCALANIAKAMVELEPYCFQTGGLPEFTASGHVTDMGPTLAPPTRSMQGELHERARAEAWDSARAFYARHFDTGPEGDPGCSDHRGCLGLLKLLVAWMPEPRASEGGFVLSHPRFALQDFIVSEEGELVGITGWSGVAFVPRSLGYERYPSWLTQDLDLSMYGWHEDGHVEKGDCRCEDSPSSLERHREEYEHHVQAKLPQRRLRRSGSQTAVSLYTENLDIAAGNLSFAAGILQSLVQLAATAIDGEPPEDFSAHHMIRRLAVGGELDAETLNHLKKGFLALLDKAGLR